MSALPILTILKNGETIRSQDLESEVVIGRGDGCVIRLDDRAVSRSHARLKPMGDGVQIEKQSEFAPMSVNGAEVTRAMLKEGDVVEIGPYLMKLSMKKIDRPAPAPAPVFASPVAPELPRDAAPILEMPPVVAEDAPESASEDPFATPELGADVLAEATASAPASIAPAGEPSTSELFGATPESDPASAPLEAAGDQPTNLLEVGQETVLTDSLSTSDGNDPLAGLGAFGDVSGADTGQASPDGLATPIDPTMGQEPGAGFSDPAAAPIDPAPAADAFGLNGAGIFDNLENNSGSPLGESRPMEVDGTAALNYAPPAAEDDRTNVGSLAVDAKIVLISGTANHRSFDLTESEVSIGRGKNCDIVIDDKKASRKNTLILKDGNRYVVRDLDSANGTYLNGTQVKEAALAGDDVIQIGATEIRFVAVNPMYERQARNFLSVPAEQLPASAAFAHPLAPDLDSVQGLGANPAAGIAGIDGASQKRSLYDRYIRNFGSLKPMQKLLVVLVLGFGAYTFLEEDPVPQKPVVQQGQKKPGEAGSKQAGVLTLESLTPEQREFVNKQYSLAFEFYSKKDYNQSLYEIGKIYPILPDWEKAKELERYALEGKKKLAAIEEERQKKEEEARLKARVAEYVEKARGLMTKKKYDAAREVFPDIVAIEPDNPDVSNWQKEIDAYLEEKQRQEQERLVQEEINKRGWDSYNEAYELHKASKFHDAIDAYKKIGDLGVSDRRLLDKARTMIDTCVESIRELRDPVLAKAKELESSGELASAFKEYEKATKIDPPHPSGYAGMDRIRDVLNDRAKVVYTEAVIAESYSDFTTAHRKFKEIMNMAPEGSLYYQRAQRKLAGYFNFIPEEPAP